MTRRKLPKTIIMDFVIGVDLQELASNIVSQLHGNGDLERFIALLDLRAEDWEITNNLIQHFKAVEKEMIKELPAGEYHLEPKKIKV